MFFVGGCALYTTDSDCMVFLGDARDSMVAKLDDCLLPFSTVFYDRLDDCCDVVASESPAFIRMLGMMMQAAVSRVYVLKNDTQALRLLYSSKSVLDRYGVDMVVMS